jgi:hypothetical protein
MLVWLVNMHTILEFSTIPTSMPMWIIIMDVIGCNWCEWWWSLWGTLRQTFSSLISRFVQIHKLLPSFPPIFQYIQIGVLIWFCFSQEWLALHMWKESTFLAYVNFFCQNILVMDNFQNTQYLPFSECQHLQCSNGLNSSQKVHSRVCIVLVWGD